MERRKERDWRVEGWAEEGTEVERGKEQQKGGEGVGKEEEVENKRVKREVKSEGRDGGKRNRRGLKAGKSKAGKGKAQVFGEAHHLQDTYYLPA